MKDQLPEIFPEPQIERITMKRIGATILAVLNLERGIFYTLWAIARTPGDAMRTYLFTDRGRFLDPIKLLVLTTAIYVFLTFNYIPDAGFVAGFKAGAGGESGSPEAQQFAGKVIAFIQNNGNLIFLLSVPIAALVSHWFFRSFRLKYTEHLVLNAYLYGFLGFVAILFVPFTIFSPVPSQIVLSFIFYLFTIYFFKDFFKIKWWTAIWKSTLIFIISMLLYYLIMLIGLIIYVLIYIK